MTRRASEKKRKRAKGVKRDRRRERGRDIHAKYIDTVA
jgi:hypothetical protein